MTVKIRDVESFKNIPSHTTNIANVQLPPHSRRGKPETIRPGKVIDDTSKRIPSNRIGG